VPFGDRCGRRDIRTWARVHGIDGRSLHAWRVNFARWRKGPAGPRRHRVQVVDTGMSTGLVELVPATQVPARSSSTCRYVLELDGARVEFGDDFSEPTLRRVVGILRSC
jgi:hypothetical protein